MKRPILTEPQYRLLARIDDNEYGEGWLASARDRQVARRLVGRECVVQFEPRGFSITDHGRNIRDLHRSFFEAQR